MCEVRRVGTVDAAAEPDHGVVLVARARANDLLGLLGKGSLRLRRSPMNPGQNLIGVAAVTANAIGVERNVRIGRVHDAARAGQDQSPIDGSGR